MKRNTKIALASAAAALPLAGCFLLDGRRGQPGWEKLLDWRYAHRGLYDNGGGIPENSLAAFRRAAEGGFGAELDVHRTADGQLVVIHDSDLARVCGRVGKVEELSWEELSRCRLLGTEEGIPLLSEVLPLFAGTAPLIVELKPIRGNEAVLAEETCALLDSFPDLDYCLESFDPFAVLWLRSTGRSSSGASCPRTFCAPPTTRSFWPASCSPPSSPTPGRGRTSSPGAGRIGKAPSAASAAGGSGCRASTGR